MKKISIIYLFIFSIIFFSLILIKNSKPYYYNATFWVYCSNEISNFDKYFHLLPSDTWVIHKKFGRITIRSHLNNLDSSTINNKKKEIMNLSKKILNFVNSNKEKIVDPKSCNLYGFHQRKIDFYGPTIYLESDEVVDNSKKNKIKVFIFILNLFFTIFFIFKFKKINLSRLYHL